MRLHTMELAAIGPFATQQRVDFDELGASGLFLLDGPTGAGKSTVLDAITFALYGAGRNGGDGRLHSDFAAPLVAPFVQLEFSLRGVRHRITRTPEYERPKRRGGGVTVAHATAHLERWEGGAWVSRSSNKAEVAQMIDEAIGLSREQFNQVVLLPQGEFASFLRAKDDERRAVLTQLFGTQLYERMTEELETRRQAAAREIATAADQVTAALAAAAEAAGLDAAARDALGVQSAADRHAALADLRGRLTAGAASAEQQLTIALAAIAAARASHAGALAAAQQVMRYADARTAWDRMQSEHEDVVRARHELATAVQAEPVRALIAAADAAETRRAEAAQSVARWQPDPDAGPGAAWSAAAAGAAAEDAARQAAELHHLIEREAGLADARRQADAVRATLIRAEAAAQQAADALRELPDRIAAALARDTAVERRAGVTARHAAAVRVTSLTSRRDDLRSARDAAVDAHQAHVDAHQQMVERRLAGMAAELAGALRDGQPCGVCGATDHPAPARPAAGTVTAAALAKADRERTAAEQRRREVDAELAQVDAELAADYVLVGSGSVDALAAELAELDACIAAASTADVADLYVERDALTAGHETALAEIANARAGSAHADRELAELTATLVAAAAGAESVAARRTWLRDRAEHFARLSAALHVFDAATQACRDAADRALAEARSAGFDTLADATGAIRSAAQRAELTLRIETWQAGMAAAQRALDDSAGGLPERELSEVLAEAQATVVDATAHLAAAEAAGATAMAASARAAHALERFSARCDDLDAAYATHDALAAQAAPVMHLARLARGMAGHRRVALTTYVLRHWFGLVVEAANVRLRTISCGRYELVRVDEGESKNERVGLTLQVIDGHTGEARNPRSLSGGETFYTSLALALGLADVVKAEAGGVDLDTLFIDEGFGSLDPDTLSQVMDVIDDLRDGGRVVGVVSHVAELKERIPERLEVRRLADGSSALKVVA